jgi:hypothetical protein
MYEELRQAMDGSLLQRFQDSLGDAFAAALNQQPKHDAPPRHEPAEGGGGASPREQSSPTRQSSPSRSPAAAAGAMRQVPLA